MGDDKRGSAGASTWEVAAERLDLHNASISGRAARFQLCGMLDLRSGRVCLLPAHHRGSCRFVPRDELGRHVEAPATDSSAG